MKNKINQESSKYTVTLEKVLKSKPFETLRKAAEVGLELDNARHKSRDELAELLFYEQNNLSAFKKMFLEQVEFAMKEYF
jgi:hypothetical protein